MKELGYRALSETILPPDSTSADLQSAVDSATSGDIIVISNDMSFTGTVTIPDGKEITIQSDTSNNWVMLTPGSYIRHFTVKGSLILQNITLDGGNIGGGVAITGGSLTMNTGAVVQNCKSNSSGGGINANNGDLTMNEGAVVQNSYSSGSGGGASVNPNGIITINGGIIKGNTAFGAGGGIMFQESTFIMTAGEFLGNTAGASGGAIQTLGNNTITVLGGIISGNAAGFQGGGIGIPTNTNASISNVIISENTAKSNGGGLFVQGIATMSDVTISKNTANVLGGGIYSYARGQTEITGESYIINNNAPNGGGIYTAAPTYNNLATGSETVFRCNRASMAYQPPVDAGTLYPNIQFASTSITEHPLNNFDINYKVGEPIDVYYNVIYDANDGIGGYTGPGIIYGGTDMVLSQDKTGIIRSGYTFTGWNTEPDGSGIPYAPGDTIIITCNVMLYAQWVAAQRFTITYGANGGSGSFEDSGMQYGTSYTILSTNQTGIGHPGFTFISWNTQPDGSGKSFAPGEIITISGDVRLYALWRQNPAPTPKKLCRAPVTKCRTSIEGQKIWIDDDNAKNTRPLFAEIILMRDGKIYKRTNVDSTGDGYFSFCCVPKWKNSSQKYNYQIDETQIPGYSKTIEAYNVINTLAP